MRDGGPANGRLTRQQWVRRVPPATRPYAQGRQAGERQVSARARASGPCFLGGPYAARPLYALYELWNRAQTVEHRKVRFQLDCPVESSLSRGIKGKGLQGNSKIDQKNAREARSMALQAELKSATSTEAWQPQAQLTCRRVLAHRQVSINTHQRRTSVKLVAGDLAGSLPRARARLAQQRRPWALPAPPLIIVRLSWPWGWAVPRLDLVIRVWN